MKLRPHTDFDTAKKQAAYAHAVFQFAERWADRMEQLVGGGATVAGIAEQASADVAGSTSSTQRAKALRLLIQHWDFGDELRAWYLLSEHRQLDHPSTAAVRLLGTRRTGEWWKRGIRWLRRLFRRRHHHRDDD